MKAYARMKLRFPDEHHVQMVLDSLGPETKGLVSRRARTTIEKKDDDLFLTVQARDTVALRASLNAYLRWIGSILNVLEVVEDRKPHR